MPLNSDNQYPKRKKKDETASVIADIHGVSDRYVRMVMEGERNDDAILNDCITYRYGKNLLIEAVKKAVPFTIITTEQNETN